MRFGKLRVRAVLLCGGTLIAAMTGATPPAAGQAAAGQAAPTGRGATPPALAAALRADFTSQPGGTPGRPALRGAGTITGVVSGAGAAPLAGACVTARGPAGAVTGITHADGRYFLPALAPGAYSVEVSGCAAAGRYFDRGYGETDPAGGARAVAVSPGRVTSLRPVSLVLVRAGMSRLSVMPVSSGPRAAHGGRISGTVRDTAGKRLAGICVEIFGGTGQPGTFIVEETGSRGGYRAGGLPTGKYVVQFSSGCGNGGNYAPQWWKYAARTSKKSFLHVTPGAAFTGIDARLGPGAAISGRVRAGSRSGRGLSGVCVIAQGTGPAQDVFSETQTGRGGTYVVKDLATGPYELTFRPDCGNQGNYLPTTLRGIHTRVTTVTKGADSFLPVGGQIRGTVTDANGHPVPGICVDATNTDGGQGTITGGNGTYTIGRLATGRYRIDFEGDCGNRGSFADQWFRNRTNSAAADPVSVVAGQVKNGISAALRPGATVAGKVTDPAGHPLRGICVAATTPSVTEYFSPNDFVAGEDTGRNGTYQIPDLPPGAYQVTFTAGCGPGSYAQQWFKNAPGFGSASLVSADAGKVTHGIGAVMQPGGAMSGQVTQAAGGKPLNAYCVTVTSMRTGEQQQFFFGNASYRIGDLAAGRYRVEFSGACTGHDLADQWYQHKSQPSAATLVTVTPGHTTGDISGALTPGGEISGTARSGSGAQVCVLAFNFFRGSTGFGISDAHGRFLIGGLDTAPYQLDYFLCKQGRSNLAGSSVAKPVNVVAGKVVSGLHFALHPGGAVAGVVRGGRSSPIPAPGVCAELLPRSGNGAGALVTTSHNGSYVAHGLAPGSYTVEFTADCPEREFPANLAPEWYDNQRTLAGATPVAVTAGHVAGGISVTLAHNGRIRGTVTAASGQPLTGVCVRAERTVAAADAPGRGSVIAVTGNGGRYSMTDVNPGRYRVQFSSGCGGATSYRTRWYGGPSQAKATVINIPAGTIKAGIDAALTPAG